MKKKIAIALGTILTCNFISPIITPLSHAEEQPNESLKINHVIIEGLKELKQEDLLKYITTTQVNTYYTKESVEKDLMALINSGLVQDAKAKTVQSNGELYVVFDVEEVADVKNVNLKGMTLIDNKEIENKLLTREGEKFTKENVNQDIETIKKAYEDKGYLAVVSNVNIKNKGEVTFSISEAQLEGIKYIGNEKTKDWVLDKTVKAIVKENDYLTTEKLQTLYQNLMQTGYFEDVKISADDSANNGKIILQIEFKEAKTGEWNLGGGYNSKYKTQLMGGIKDKNIKGEAKEFGLDFSFGKNKDAYRLSYTDKYYKKTDTSVSVDIFKTSSDEETAFSKYTENHEGASINMIKPISEDKKTKFFTTFTTDKISTENIEGVNIEGIRTNSISLGVINDRRDNTIDPKNGTMVTAQLLTSQKAFGSDTNFTKVLIDARKYISIASKDVLATRFMFNYSPNDLPTVEQFRVGGSDSVRGLDEDAQRGNKSIIANIEYRHDLSDKIQGVVFIDAGKAWNDNIDNALKVSAGLGLRIKTAMGLLRLDAAKTSGNSMKYMFGFGHTF